MKVLENIKHYRKLKSLSQEEMSDRLGMSQNNYGKIERGDTELTVVRLVEISKILETPIFELVGEDLNGIVELIKQTYETQLKYTKADVAKNNVIIKSLLKDLEYYRNILFEKGLIDAIENKRGRDYIAAQSRVIINEESASSIEKGLKREYDS